MTRTWPELMQREVTQEMIDAVEKAARSKDGTLHATPDGMTVAEFSTAVTLCKASLKPEPDVKAVLADEAKAIVTGARRSAYGAPEDNFERIARFWQAYFENTGRGAVNITAADVSPLMRLMKEARLCETPDHRDSFVDLIGYTLTGAEINKVDPQKSS